MANQPDSGKPSQPEDPRAGKPKGPEEIKPEDSGELSVDEAATLDEASGDAIRMEDAPVAPAMGHSDSEIDLGRDRAQQGQASSDPERESVPWDQLVNEAAVSGDPHSPGAIKIDSPSDQEVLRAAAAVEDSGVHIEEGSMTMDDSDDEQSSHVDLSKGPPSADPLGSDHPGSKPSSKKTGVDFRLEDEAEFIETPGGLEASGVNLNEEAASSAMLLDSSGRLVPKGPEEAFAAAEDEEGKSFVLMPDSGVNLGEPGPATGATGPGSRPPDASGVDLAGANTGSVVGMDVVQIGDESSAVDLGAPSPSESSLDSSGATGKPSSGAALAASDEWQQLVGAEPSSSTLKPGELRPGSDHYEPHVPSEGFDVEQGRPGSGRAATVSDRAAEEPFTAAGLARGDSGDEAQEVVGERSVVAAEDEEVKKKPEKVRGGGGGLLVGAAAGLLVGILGSAAFWAFGGNPPAFLRETMGTDAPTKAADEAKKKAEQQLASVRGQLDSAKKDRDDAQEKLKEADGKLTSSSAELEKARETASKATGALTAANKDKEKAEAAAKEAVGKFTEVDNKRKDAEKKVDELTGTIGTVTKERDQLKLDLTKSSDLVTKVQSELKTAATRLDTEQKRAADLDKQQKNLAGALTQIASKLKVKDFDPKDGPDKLLSSVEDALKLAGSKDPRGELASAQQSVRTLEATLKQRWTPEQMLGHWLPVVADRGQKTLAASAVADARRVKASPATAEVKAQALCVEGLALRNQGKYVEARAALTEGAKALKGPWKTVADQALAELSDPAAYYLPKAEGLRAARKAADAVVLLDEAVLVFPKDNGRLLALRSLARLDVAVEKAKGKLQPESAGVKEAKQDAEAAIKAGAAGSGHFAAGRIAEEVGDRTEAVKHFREATKLLPASDTDGARSRLALARLLLQSPSKPAARLDPIKSRRWLAEVVRPRQLLASSDALVMMTIALQAPTAGLADEETIKLADEILARKDIDSMPLLKAQALAIKGLHTQALKTYAEGLSTQLSREQVEGLKAIIDNHPALKRPDTMRVAQPLLAERHYAAGLTRYFERKYAAAEKEFVKAVEADAQDARYFYFLGLSQLQQGKRDALENLDEAAKLEQQDRPSLEAVNAALERIQGSLRRKVEEARIRNR